MHYIQQMHWLQLRWVVEKRPAEWAINHFCSMGLRVIYTSPIKALSNEKKYNLTNKFPNISFGILTGDTVYGENSDCLIMTTEILHNNLFKQLYKKENSKNVTLDFEMDYSKLAIVIFDEIHWINDKDRGGVWDQTISLLQSKFPNTLLLGLSATCDNPTKMCRLMGKKVFGYVRMIKVFLYTLWFYYSTIKNVRTFKK